MLSADAHVPRRFNPMFVLGFLQSTYQSRFELTVERRGRRVASASEGGHVR